MTSTGEFGNHQRQQLQKIVDSLWRHLVVFKLIWKCDSKFACSLKSTVVKKSVMTPSDELFNLMKNKKLSVNWIYYFWWFFYLYIEDRIILIWKIYYFYWFNCSNLKKYIIEKKNCFFLRNTDSFCGRIEIINIENKKLNLNLSLLLKLSIFIYLNYYS